jgi:hypothetical protein
MQNVCLIQKFSRNYEEKPEQSLLIQRKKKHFGFFGGIFAQFLVT